MADQLQLRGGTTAEHASFTGALREITVDTDKDTVVVHDNATVGGHPLQKQYPALGSAAAPTYTFTGDTNTGIYSPGADQVAISTGGTGRLFVNSTGLTSLGQATSPNNLTLSVGGSDTQSAVGMYKNGTLYGVIGSESAYNGSGSSNNLSIASFGAGNDVKIIAPNNYICNAGGSERMRIDSQGRVGIGSYTGLGYKLNVYEAGTGMLNALHLGSGGGSAGNGASISFGLGAAFDPTANILAKIGGIYTGGAYDGALTFHTNPGSDGASPRERARITSDGYLRLAGKGIQFNGDTADANSLDDYEEGTFNAVLNFGGVDTGSYAWQQSWYTKIGNLVTVFVELVVGGTPTGTGNATVSNLPFTVLNAGDIGSSARVTPAGGNGILNVTTEGFAAIAIKNTTTVNLYQVSNGSLAALTDSNLKNFQSGVAFTVSYRAA